MFYFCLFLVFLDSWLVASVASWILGFCGFFGFFAFFGFFGFFGFLASWLLGFCGFLAFGSWLLASVASVASLLVHNRRTQPTATTNSENEQQCKANAKKNMQTVSLTTKPEHGFSCLNTANSMQNFDKTHQT